MIILIPFDKTIWFCLFYYFNFLIVFYKKIFIQLVCLYQIFYFLFCVKMSRVTFWALVILWLWALVLTGCNKSENIPVEEKNSNPSVEDSTLSKDVKTSLTLEELENIQEINFPKSYAFSVYNIDENKLEDKWEYTYPADVSHTLLIPEHATMVSREVISSWIEDWMIYTMTKVELQDGTQLDVLYINDPLSLDFVAVSVENGNTSTNYQFTY